MATATPERPRFDPFEDYRATVGAIQAAFDRHAPAAHQVGKELTILSGTTPLVSHVYAQPQDVLERLTLVRRTQLGGPADREPRYRFQYTITGLDAAGQGTGSTSAGIMYSNPDKYLVSMHTEYAGFRLRQLLEHTPFTYAEAETEGLNILLGAAASNASLAAERRVLRGMAASRRRERLVRWLGLLGPLNPWQ